MYSYLNVKVILLFVWLGILSSITGCAHHHDNDTLKTNADLFGYRNFNGGGFIIDQKNKSIQVGDVGLAATYCREADNYFCVNSSIFHFAVPKHFDAALNSWKQEGYSYKIEMPMHDQMAFGITISIVIISSIGPKDKGKPAPTVYYFYSPTKGLLAIESITAGDSESQILISTNQIGFGAHPIKGVRIKGVRIKGVRAL